MLVHLSEDQIESAAIELLRDQWTNRFLDQLSAGQSKVPAHWRRRG